MFKNKKFINQILDRSIAPFIRIVITVKTHHANIVDKINYKPN